MRVMETEKKEKLLTICVVSITLILLILATHLLIKNYTMEKKFETGKILCVQLLNASITHYHRTGKYLVNDKVTHNEEYPFDARTNPYFSVFSTYPAGGRKQAISVFGSGEMDKYELRVVFDEDSETKNIKNIKIQTLTKEY